MLSENVFTEEFLMFIWDFKKNIEGEGVTSTSGLKKYLHTLLRGESLHKFDLVGSSIGTSMYTHLKKQITGIGNYLTPFNSIDKQKYAIFFSMQRPRSLKTRRFTA